MEVGYAEEDRRREVNEFLILLFSADGELPRESTCSEMEQVQI